MEHLQASMRFQWRHRQFGDTIDLMRQDIQRQLMLHHPGHPPDSHQTMVFLESRTGMNPDLIRQCLLCPIPTRETDLIDLVSQLQRLRSAL
jgi:hypothetical protein